MITNKCGVYKITNTINGDYYIGSSCDIQRRINCHHRLLVNNTHYNSYLQRAWNKYGENNFEFTTLLLCDVEHKLYFEQGFLDLFKPVYNAAINATAFMQGLHCTEEHKRKISEANTGRKCSKESKQKMSDVHKGIPSSMRGKHLSEEQKRKISETLKGNLPWNINKFMSEESKHKNSESQKGKHHSEESKRKNSESHKGKKPTDEAKRRMSGARKCWWAEKKITREAKNVVQ